MEAKLFENVLKKSFPTSIALMFLKHGMMITPFVRLWLTMTMIESSPHMQGGSVMRLIESCLKGKEEVNGIRFKGGQGGWVFALFC